MSKIKKIYLLIHPTFHGIYEDPRMELHVSEEELREEWWNVAKEVSKSEDSVFIEFTATDFADYSYLKASLTPESFITVREKFKIESDREKQFHEMLGKKYFIFPGKVLPKFLAWNRIFKEVDLELDTEIEIHAFGEFFDNCVEIWSEELEEQLVKDGTKVKRIKHPELSLIKVLNIQKDRDKYGEKISRYW